MVVDCDVSSLSLYGKGPGKCVLRTAESVAKMIDGLTCKTVLNVGEDQVD